MQNKVSRTVGAVRAAFDFLTGFCLLGMMVMVLLQAGGRYLFHYSLDWLTELSSLLQVALGVFGFGVAYRVGTLFAVEAIFDYIGQRPGRILRAVITLLSLAFCVTLIYGVITLAIAVPSQVTPSLGIPKWMVYALVPIGFAYAMFEMIVISFIPRPPVDDEVLP